MRRPEFPEPLGVFRCVERPTYEDMLVGQVSQAVRDQGEGTLEDLFDNGEAWIVN